MRLMTFCLILFLTACQSNVRTVEVYPPLVYLQECRINYPDRTEHGVIAALAQGVHCERAGKQAARCWIAKRKGETGSPDCMNPLPCEENHNNRGGDNVGGDAGDSLGACFSGGNSANYNTHSSESDKGKP